MRMRAAWCWVWNLYSRFYSGKRQQDKPGKRYHAPSLAEQPPAADCLQRPLVPRSRFRQRLRRSVRPRLLFLWCQNDHAIRKNLAGEKGPQSMIHTLFYPRRFPILSLVILGLLLVIPGAFALQIAPHDPIKGALSNRLKPPMWVQGGSSDFPLGTDKVGRDILSRIIHGARVSLVVATVAILISGCISIMLGVVAGYFGGRLNALIIHLETLSGWIAMALLLGLTFGVLLGALRVSGFWGVIMVLGVLLWPLWSPYIRQARSTVLSLRQHGFIAKVRVVGGFSGSSSVLLGHAAGWACHFPRVLRECPRDWHSTFRPLPGVSSSQTGGSSSSQLGGSQRSLGWQSY